MKTQLGDYTPPKTVTFTDARGRTLAEIERQELDPARHLFKAGNQAAVKAKWSSQRLKRFARALAALRNRLGYNYSAMGRALGVTGTYIKQLETGAKQPSEKLAHAVYQMKASGPAGTPALEAQESQTLERLDDLWKHVLVRRFRCPECWNEHRRGQRPKALCYWWHPTRKHCPAHSRRKAHRRGAGGKP